jgi:hypothetical protein
MLEIVFGVVFSGQSRYRRTDAVFCLMDNLLNGGL